MREWHTFATMFSANDLGQRRCSFRPPATRSYWRRSKSRSKSLGNKQSYVRMSKLFDDLAAIDRKIADRWKIGTRDNNKHVLVRGRCHRTSFRAIDFADSLLYNNDLGYMNGSGSRLSLSTANLWVPMSITRRAFLRFTAGAARLAAGLGGAMVGYAAGFEPNDLVSNARRLSYRSYGTHSMGSGSFC